MMSEPNDRWRPLLLAVGVEGGLALVAILIGWLTGCWPLADFSWDSAALFWGIVGTLPMLSVLVAIEWWPVKPVTHLRGLFDDLLRPLLRRCSVAELAVISLLAGLGEEMLFRGLLQG